MMNAAQENSTHGKQFGFIRFVGVDNPANKLTEENVISIKKLLSESKNSLRSIGRMYNVSATIISHIKKEKLWKHIQL